MHVSQFVEHKLLTHCPRYLEYNTFRLVRKLAENIQFLAQTFVKSHCCSYYYMRTTFRLNSYLLTCLFAKGLETECRAKQSSFKQRLLQIQVNNCRQPVISREKPQKNEQQRHDLSMLRLHFSLVLWHNVNINISKIKGKRKCAWLKVASCWTHLVRRWKPELISLFQSTK